MSFFNKVDLHTSAIRSFCPLLPSALKFLTDPALSVTFPNSTAVCCMQTSMSTLPRPVVIQGTKGSIELIGPPYRPHGFVVLDLEQKEVERFDYDWDAKKGSRMYFEADEVARCIAAGKQQSERMSWDDSLRIMAIFDEIVSPFPPVPGFKFSTALTP